MAVSCKVSFIIEHIVIECTGKAVSCTVSRWIHTAFTKRMHCGYMAATCRLHDGYLAVIAGFVKQKLTFHIFDALAPALMLFNRLLFLQQEGTSNTSLSQFRYEEGDVVFVS